MKFSPLNRVETKTFQKLKLKELFEKDMMFDIFELREASFIAEEVCKCLTSLEGTEIECNQGVRQVMTPVEKLAVLI